MLCVADRCDVSVCVVGTARGGARSASREYCIVYVERRCGVRCLAEGMAEGFPLPFRVFETRTSRAWRHAHIWVCHATS